MEGDQQAALAPFAGPAPGRVEHHLVERGAEDVAGAEHGLFVDALVAGIAGKRLDFLDHLEPQPLGVRMGRGIFQAHDQAEQGRSRSFQRIQTPAGR